MDVALQQRMINCKAAILGVNKITCVHPQKSIQSTIYLSCVTCIHLQLACLLGDVFYILGDQQQLCHIFIAKTLFNGYRFT